MAVAGLCLGSFASVLIYRSPRGIDVTGLKSGGSACASCGSPLTSRDLIPILSWVFARGRCRVCKAGISFLYPALEISALILALGIALTYGPSWGAVPMLLSIPFFLAISVLDYKNEHIPAYIMATPFIFSMFYALCFAVFTGLFPWANFLGALFLSLFTLSANFLYHRFRGRYIFKPYLPILAGACGFFIGLDAAATFLFGTALFAIFTLFLQKKGTDGKKQPVMGLGMIISLYLHVFLTGLGIE
jgi:prepilin signal peptidase PulO-like enzyme (type II secretory pathway)